MTRHFRFFCCCCCWWRPRETRHYWNIRQWNWMEMDHSGDRVNSAIIYIIAKLLLIWWVIKISSSDRSHLLTFFFFSLELLVTSGFSIYNSTQAHNYIIDGKWIRLKFIKSNLRQQCVDFTVVYFHTSYSIILRQPLHSIFGWQNFANFAANSLWWIFLTSIG